MPRRHSDINFFIADLANYESEHPKFDYCLPSVLSNSFKPKQVIYNNPATIVYWMDGTKTVVKCSEYDTFDEEKGFAMALMKRVYGKKKFHMYLKDLRKTYIRQKKGDRL